MRAKHTMLMAAAIALAGTAAEAASWGGWSSLGGWAGWSGASASSRSGSSGGTGWAVSPHQFNDGSTLRDLAGENLSPNGYYGGGKGFIAASGPGGLSGTPSGTPSSGGSATPAGWGSAAPFGWGTGTPRDWGNDVGSLPGGWGGEVSDNHHWDAIQAQQRLCAWSGASNRQKRRCDPTLRRSSPSSERAPLVPETDAGLPGTPPGAQPNPVPSPAPIPLPAAGWLLLGGVAAIGGLRLRRRA